ncbi:hypothetical protein [Streptomyces sp. NPDC000877]|uniref:hypothetical protein n=1 Tax=unclassified Streptomyces TaxID=2593676 RepID=UPI00332A2C90
MVLLPPELRSRDGHLPLAELAAKVMADLTKTGVVVHVIDDSDDDSHVNGGVTLSLGPASAGVSLAWHVPNELRMSKSETRQKEVVFGAAAALTSAIISILTNFGHRVRTEFNEPGYPYPLVYVLSPDTGTDT